MVVTLPYFSGKHRITSSEGVTFKELSDGLAEIVEKQSKKKRVTLIIHDWGSLIGFFFQHDRPDLVSRIITLDIGGHIEQTFTYKLFSRSYQLFFCLLFAIGDPISTFILQKMNAVKKKNDFGTPPRDYNEIKGSMLYPYWHIYFNHIYNSKDQYLNWISEDGLTLHKLDAAKCPVFFAYGAKKPLNFHSEKWLK